MSDRCTCGCCHVPDHGACDTFERGMNGRCVYCDHGEECHPGSGERFNLPLTVGVRSVRAADDEVHIPVDQYLRSDTEQGRLYAIRKMPRDIRLAYTGGFRFLREEQRSDGRWFIFRGI
jgi:hypothetical protein